MSYRQMGSFTDPFAGAGSGSFNPRGFGGLPSTPSTPTPNPAGGGFLSNLNPLGLALAGGQLALGVANMVQAGRAREQQVYNTTYQNTLNQKLREFATQQKNEQITRAFSSKLDYVTNQIENNFLAAQASWTSEQMRLNDIYAQAAYRSQGMQRRLKEALGASAAREVYGKSARRGALVATLGAYGRTRAQLVDQLMSENVATRMRMERTEQQKRARDKLAIAQVSELPMFYSTFSEPPAMPAGGRGLGLASDVLGIGMQAFSAYRSV